MVETLDQSATSGMLAVELADRLKEALGVRLKVETVARGGLDHLTGLSATSKIKRLIDKRRVVWRFGSPHRSCSEPEMRTSEPKPRWINKLLVSFDSEARKRACRRMRRTSESGHWPSG